MARNSSAATTGALIGLLLMAATAAATPFSTTSERRVISTSTPVYPSKARDARLEGDVTVCYTIDARGRVRRPYIESSSHRVFNRAARKAAKAIAYAPAEAGASNDKAPACSTFRFRLESQTDVDS